MRNEKQTSEPFVPAAQRKTTLFFYGCRRFIFFRAFHELIFECIEKLVEINGITEYGDNLVLVRSFAQIFFYLLHFFYIHMN